MKRFLSWCRRPYLRIYFTPDWQRLAEEGVKTAKAATATAQQAFDSYQVAQRQLDKLRDELHAYFCSSLEEEAQVAELERMQ